MIVPRFAGLDQAEDVLAAAHGLFDSPDWVAALLAPLIRALTADPWFDPPLRVTRDAVRTAMVLADLPGVTLTASVTAAAALAARPVPATVVLSGRRSLTWYPRGGDALVRRWCLAGDGAAQCVEDASQRLVDGQRVELDGRCAGRLIVAAARDVVAVTATVKAGCDPLMREYATCDGRLVRCAAVDDRASRAELLLAFLRADQRRDAGGCFDALSRDCAHHLRWAAMREWLMLDARAARPRLAEMAAGDDDDGVRAAAVATLARLDAQLACNGGVRCRA